MAYQVELDVGISEFAVSRAIQELETVHETFTTEDIAKHIGCHTNTVIRACQRLLEAGIVNREGTKRHGYRYEYIGDKRNSNV